MTPRRTVLAAAASLSLLSAAGCRSSDLFAGPDPLGSPPPLARDTQVLQAMIAAETQLIALYQADVSHAREGLLAGLLAEHEQHLSQLRAWLVVPPGAANPSPVPSPSPSVISGPVTVAQPKAAEQRSSLTFLQYLNDVPPALAQLFASIAASDFTHQAALSAI